MRDWSRSDYTGYQPSGLAAGDLDADGKPDLAVADSGPATGGVVVRLNGGDGRFPAVVIYPVGANLAAAQSIAVGDLNGDNAPDLATANDSGTVGVLLNAGAGTFGAAVE